MTVYGRLVVLRALGKVLGALITQTNRKSKCAVGAVLPGLWAQFLHFACMGLSLGIFAKANTAYFLFAKYLSMLAYVKWAPIKDDAF